MKNNILIDIHDMKQTKKEIEKPWCVTHGIWKNPREIGKIVEDGQKSLEIKYSEEVSSESWDPKYVKRFPTLEEATNYFIENLGPTDIRERNPLRKEIELNIKMCFPSYFKKEHK